MEKNEVAIVYLEKIIRNVSGETKYNATMAKILLKKYDLEDLSNRVKILHLIKKEMPKTKDPDKIVSIVLLVYNEFNNKNKYTKEIRSFLAKRKLNESLKKIERDFEK